MHRFLQSLRLHSSLLLCNFHSSMAALNAGAPAYYPQPATGIPFIIWNAPSPLLASCYPPTSLHYTNFTGLNHLQLCPSLSMYMGSFLLENHLVWQNPTKIPYHGFPRLLPPTHESPTSIPFSPPLQEEFKEKKDEKVIAGGHVAEISKPGGFPIVSNRPTLKGSRKEKIWLRKNKGAESGGGGKTTLMIRHIPVKYTKEMLLKLLDDHCVGENQKLKSGGQLKKNLTSAYNFIYLPIDFGTNCNKGYAFVNFTNATGASRLRRALDGYKWELLGSKKICHITYARIQGRDALKKHFESSTFPCETEAYLPVFFDAYRNGSCRFESYTVGIRISPAEKQQPS